MVVVCALSHFLSRFHFQDYIISDGKVINECRAVGGMRVGRGN
jgi:hypothetical protein